MITSEQFVSLGQRRQSEDFEAQRRADAEAMGLSAVEIESATGAYLPARTDAYAKLRDFVAAQSAA